jgi:hypothetical protein
MQALFVSVVLTWESHLRWSSDALWKVQQMSYLTISEQWKIVDGHAKSHQRYLSLAVLLTCWIFGLARLADREDLLQAEDLEPGVGGVSECEELNVRAIPRLDVV